MSDSDSLWSDYKYDVPRLRRRETVRCAFCTNVCKWEEHQGKWRMVELDGEFHNCHPMNPKPLKPESKSMQIQILNVTKVPATTSKGEAYNALEVAFKNLTFQGKVEGKKLTPYGNGKASYLALANAGAGQVYDIEIVKENGFNNWVKATLGQEGAADNAPSAASTPYASAPPRAGGASAAPAARTSTYETPEERAKKQVYIIRQSSLSTAVAALSVGVKSPPSSEVVIAYAKDLEAFVFGRDVAPGADTGFDDLDNDIPV